MPRPPAIIAWLATLVPAAQPLAAQTASDICRSAFKRLSPGNWAEYRITSSRRPADAPTTMRVAMIGTEGTGDAILYWFESKFASTEGDMIVRVLIPGWPYDPSQVRAMVMKLGSQPAMRVPENVIAMMRQRVPSTGLDAMRKCAGATVVGREAIEVPAGTVAAVHLKPATDSGDLWVTSDLPFGLVKWAGPTGDVILAAHGVGAKSLITEEPQDLPGMGGAPGRP